MRRVLTASLALLFVTSGQAAGQRYLAVGDPASLSFAEYVEVWGVGSNSRYANPATKAGDPFNFLVANALDATNAPDRADVTGASVAFGYDPGTPLISISPSGRSYRYAAAAMQMDISLSGGALGLHSNDNAFDVSTSTSRNSQFVSFGPSAGTTGGPLPGAGWNFSAPPGSATTYTVDLVSLLGASAYTSRGFDLSAFVALPVRLTTPTVFEPVAFGANFARFLGGGNFGNAPPGSLALADFNSDSSFGLYLDGLFGVAVEAGDYASTGDFLAAKSWVDSNIRQINFEAAATWRMASLTAVPEPGQAWLLLSGLPWLLVRARRRAGV